MKTRNLVAKHQRLAGKGGAHTDRKKQRQTSRKAKHKGRSKRPFSWVLYVV